MATWTELSQDNLRAAKLLAQQDFLRGSSSRSYYAAYCAIASELAARGASFARGWNNPAHDQLYRMVAYTLPYPLSTRRRINRVMRLLRKAREDVDYRPGISISSALTRECLQNAGWLVSTMEITDD